MSTTLIPLSSIILGERQRSELGAIAELADSLRRNGLIQPIVVTPDEVEEGKFLLVAGGRRLSAAKKLEWEAIEAKLLADLSESERTILELEENIRRKNLSWQEECKAVLRFCQLTGKAGVEAARDLGVSPDTVSNYCNVAKSFAEMPRLAEQATYGHALSMWKAVQDRRREAIREAVAAEENLVVLPSLTEAERAELQEGDLEIELEGLSALAAEPAVHALNPFSVERADFREWAASYRGERFNLVHCDFPYGLNFPSSNMQTTSGKWRTEEQEYSDSPELFEELSRAFIKHRNNFIADSAHVIFWTAFRQYHWVEKMLSACDFVVCPVPLVWHKSDGQGMAPDPTRQPRRTAEFAIFASRGDRRILKVKANSFAHPTTKEFHLSEKPMTVLKHFFEMVVDDTTRVLDPSAGSGNAILAAMDMGARSGLALDVEPSFVSNISRRIGE